MANTNAILTIHKDSFCANVYTLKHFRMIGLIDVDIEYYYGIQRVTLPYYSSSGTNNGKIKGLWYPIVGIKTKNGYFTEFTDYINYVLAHTTRDGMASKDWLAKSLFFYKMSPDPSKIAGFSNGRHYEALLNLGQTLRDLYEQGAYQNVDILGPTYLNKAVTSKLIYSGNTRSQQENFERFIHDIYYQY